MAENKQYITQEQENGTVMISEDVIASIVVQSLVDIEGFVGLTGKPGMEIVELLGKKNWGKGLKVVFGENDALTIECNILISYGQSVVNVAKAVQQAVIAAVESMTGLTGICVNVNVCGIVRQ